MVCKDNDHIWDIYCIDKMISFESRILKEIITQETNLKTISICRKCKRVSFYDPESEQALYGDMFVDEII